MIKSFKELINFTFRSNVPRWPSFEIVKIGMLDPTHIVWVRSDDSCNIPCFHVSDSATCGRKFSATICIECNRYLKHSRAKSELTQEMRIQLVDFLKKTNKKGLSNWEFLVDTWNRNHPNIIIPEESEMPDYTEITQ